MFMRTPIFSLLELSPYSVDDPAFLTSSPDGTVREDCEGGQQHEGGTIQARKYTFINKTEEFAMVCLPYGPVIVFPALLAAFAWILTYTFGFGCHIINSTVSSTRTVGFGPWTIQNIEIYGYDDDTFYTTSICTPYNSGGAGGTIRDMMDSKAKTSQAFSMIAIVLSFPLFVIIMLPCCCTFKGRGLFKFTGLVCIFTSFASLMTLILKNSNLCFGNCAFGWTAWTCIVAGILWFFAGLAFCGMPGDPRETFNDGMAPIAVQEPSPVMATTGLGQEKEVTRTQNADGTFTVTTKITVPNPDGSKTVTESTEIEKP